MAAASLVVVLTLGPLLVWHVPYFGGWRQSAVLTWYEGSRALRAWYDGDAREHLWVGNSEGGLYHDMQPARYDARTGRVEAPELDAVFSLGEEALRLFATLELDANADGSCTPEEPTWLWQWTWSAEGDLLSRVSIMPIDFAREGLDTSQFHSSMILRGPSWSVEVPGPRLRAVAPPKRSWLYELLEGL
ncbi:MAG: hypothetical protein DHS20C15_12400 [Planctomycetota bacterium]|nr:MAG: hypothetical protein DHS20C15_12400 [Planctomycetota bacterium]